MYVEYKKDQSRYLSLPIPITIGTIGHQTMLASFQQKIDHSENYYSSKATTAPFISGSTCDQCSKPILHSCSF